MLTRPVGLNLRAGPGRARRRSRGNVGSESFTSSMGAQPVCGRNHARPPPVILLEFGIDDDGNPMNYEYALRREKTQKAKEPNAIQYRRISDARVTPKGQVVFNDLDHIRRPNTQELAHALADLRTGRKTSLKVWARRPRAPPKRKTKKSGQQEDDAEQSGDEDDPSPESYFTADPCTACDTVKAPSGFRNSLVVSSCKTFNFIFHH